MAALDLEDGAVLVVSSWSIDDVLLLRLVRRTTDAEAPEDEKGAMVVGRKE